MNWRPASEPPTVEGEYLTAFWQEGTRTWAYLVDTWGSVEDDGPSQWYGDSDAFPSAPRVAYWAEIDEPPPGPA